MRMYQRNGIFIVLAFLAVVVMTAFVALAPLMKDTVVATVQEKENVVSAESSKYLIYTDKEVLENGDSIWFFKFNSSDVYRDIEVGKTYRFKVYGFRVPFLSMYRNIYDLELSAAD